MLKKIALTVIFAAVSVVTFSAAPVNAAKPAPSVGAPLMRGLCYICKC